MRTKILLAASAAVLAAAVAVAAPGQGGGHRGLAKFDSNNDGAVTRAEVDAKSAERFAKIDANKDGFVTQAEIKTQRDTMRTQWAERAAKRGDKGGERAEKRGERREKRADNREAKAAEHFATRDTNKDARLSLAEFQADGGKFFERFDTDKNGSVSREEMAAVREAWKAKRKG